MPLISGFGEGVLPFVQDTLYVVLIQPFTFAGNAPEVDGNAADLVVQPVPPLLLSGGGV